MEKEEARKLVNKFVDRCLYRRHPLFFDGIIEREDTLLKESADLCSLIMNIVKVSNYRPSKRLTPTFKIETRRGARRSALDIWRHALVYKPELTIFEVMASIYRINITSTNDMTLRGWYCSTVRRLVFWENRGRWMIENRRVSEFKILFGDWGDIDK